MLLRCCLVLSTIKYNTSQVNIILSFLTHAHNESHVGIKLQKLIIYCICNQFHVFLSVRFIYSTHSISVCSFVNCYSYFFISVSLMFQPEEGVAYMLPICSHISAKRVHFISFCLFVYLFIYLFSYFVFRRMWRNVF